MLRGLGSIWPAEQTYNQTFIITENKHGEKIKKTEIKFLLKEKRIC